MNWNIPFSRISSGPQYRHELKYLIHGSQLEVLKQQLPDILQPDPYAGPSGQYCVRSIYFDDYANSCYYANMNGTDIREKFRIRIYNCDSKQIKLELKKKQQGMTLKESCSLAYPLANDIVLGNSFQWENNMNPLLKKFFIQQETRLLTPKVIVEYNRRPFIFPDGNVRVTLDTDIRASQQFDGFFRDEISFCPIMPRGFHLLEVKYDQFLPDWIFRSIQATQLSQTTFSKYYYCRKYGEFL